MSCGQIAFKSAKATFFLTFHLAIDEKVKLSSLALIIILKFFVLERGGGGGCSEADPVSSSKFN